VTLLWLKITSSHLILLPFKPTFKICFSFTVFLIICKTKRVIACNKIYDIMSRNIMSYRTHTTMINDNQLRLLLTELLFSMKTYEQRKTCTANCQSDLTAKAHHYFISILTSPKHM